MGRLRLHKQFVHNMLALRGVESKIAPKLDHGKQVERLLRPHPVRITQRAVGTADLVQ